MVLDGRLGFPILTRKGQVQKQEVMALQKSPIKSGTENKRAACSWFFLSICWFWETNCSSIWVGHGRWSGCFFLLTMSNNSSGLQALSDQFIVFFKSFPRPSNYVNEVFYSLGKRWGRRFLVSERSVDDIWMTLEPRPDEGAPICWTARWVELSTNDSD